MNTVLQSASKSFDQLDAFELAQACAAALYAQDGCSQAHGMKIESVGPGVAVLSMPVRKDMVNGHRICHGGMIFALADSAFAFACNARNASTVASGCNIDFVAPAYLDDKLYATAKEKSLAGRTGVYDIRVSNQEDKTIAWFRGKSYRLQTTVLSNPLTETNS